MIEQRKSFVPCFLEQGVKLCVILNEQRYVGVRKHELLAFSFSTVFLIFRKMSADASSVTKPLTCIRG